MSTWESGSTIGNAICFGGPLGSPPELRLRRYRAQCRRHRRESRSDRRESRRDRREAERRPPKRRPPGVGNAGGIAGNRGAIGGNPGGIDGKRSVVHRSVAHPEASAILSACTRRAPVGEVYREPGERPVRGHAPAKPVERPPPNTAARSPLPPPLGRPYGLWQKPP
jgi:hypothetical protein